MSKSPRAIRRNDLGRTARFDVMAGPSLLGQLSVNHEHRSCWSALVIPTSIEPNSLTTAQFAEFVDHVYSDLFGDLAQPMWLECRVVLGDSRRTDVAWLGDEKNRNRFQSLHDRMKQRDTPYQFVRFETAATVGSVSFSVEREVPGQPGSCIRVFVSDVRGWTPQAVDWALRRHADQELASGVDREQLAALLATTALDSHSFVTISPDDELRDIAT